MATDGALTLILRPRDPIVVRDGRPFSADPGARAETLDWPLPQTVAGALRTHIGADVGFDWGADGPARARAIIVRGPFLLARVLARVEAAADWTVYLPAPRDALTTTGDGDDGPTRVLALRPVQALPAGSGCDLPHPGLRPLAVTDDVKPSVGRPFWSLADTVGWLARPSPSDPPLDALGGPPKETRVHVGIDRATGTAAAGVLFSTTALAFAEAASPRPRATPAMAMLCRVTGAPADWQAGGFMAMGGERRMVRVSGADGTDPWPIPPVSLVAALAGTPRLRLQLATPALFAAGWWPGWLDPDTLEGAPPELAGCRLRLVGAAVGRRVPVSGWDLETRRQKAVRHAAPSGSTYFFEVVGNPLTAELAGALWLRSICDDPQDRRDGYGLVLAGIW